MGSGSWSPSGHSPARPRPSGGGGRVSPVQGPYSGLRSKRLSRSSGAGAGAARGSSAGPAPGALAAQSRRGLFTAGKASGMSRLLRMAGGERAGRPGLGRGAPRPGRPQASAPRPHPPPLPQAADWTPASEPPRPSPGPGPSARCPATVTSLRGKAPRGRREHLSPETLGGQARMRAERGVAGAHGVPTSLWRHRQGGTWVW